GITALAVNTANPVDTRSKLNALGRFDLLKAKVKEISESTGESWKVSWYQNQESVSKSRHCTATHLSNLLLHLDRIRYDFTTPGRKAHPNGNVSSSKFTSDAFFERQQELFPLLQDAFWIEKNLYELLAKHLDNPSIRGSSNLAAVRTKGSICLLDGTYYGFTTPASFSLPIVAAYRVFLSEAPPCNTWVVPFDEFCQPLLTKLWKWYSKELKREKANGNNSLTPIIRNPIVWSSVYTIADKMLRDLPDGSKRRNEAKKLETISDDSQSPDKKVTSLNQVSQWHIARLTKGVKVWNEWRASNPNLAPKLIGVNLAGVDLVKANLVGVDLTGAFLNKADLRSANLNRANLTGTDLTSANLVNVNFTGANLSEVKAPGANFYGATLTGACIQDWEIDSATNLHDVDCDYVYLRKNQQERRPELGRFPSGGFTKMFKK
ncbi:MAG: pentapeptide repeat-containing protein, partial [Xenococcaceae cyanobacterium]